MIKGKKQKHILQWHITHHCNLRCKHCYQNEYKSDMSMADMLNVLEQYKEYINTHNLHGHINFTGGEPLSLTCLNKLFRVLRQCDIYGITYGILTNGTLIDKAIVERLKTCENLKFIQMSLEGTRKVNDEIRGKGSFNQVMKSVRLLKKAGIQTMISFTIHEQNRDKLMRLINQCRIHGVDRFWTDRLIPNREEVETIGLENLPLKLITSEHYKESLEQLGKQARLSNSINDLMFRLTHQDKIFTTVVHTQRALQFVCNVPGVQTYECSAGGNLLVILADGTLLPCRRLPIPIGNVLEHSISELVASSEILKDLRETQLSDECKTCGKCKGGAKCLVYAITGSYKNIKDINCIYNN